MDFLGDFIRHLIFKTFSYENLCVGEIKFRRSIFVI